MLASAAITFAVLVSPLPLFAEDAKSYISAADVTPPQHPRKAVRAIAQRWLKQVEAWNEGRDYEGIRIAGPHSLKELAPLLAKRAKMLLDWTDDDSLWPDR